MEAEFAVMLRVQDLRQSDYRMQAVDQEREQVGVMRHGAHDAIVFFDSFFIFKYIIIYIYTYVMFE